MSRIKEESFGEAVTKQTCEQLQEIQGRTPLCLFMQANKLTVTIATAEMHHPLSHWAHIHCLVSLNFSIDECQWVTFFAHGGIQFHIHTSI